VPGRQLHRPAHPEEWTAGAMPASPDIATVEQEQHGHASVPVVVDGPVTSHALPAKRAATQTLVVGVPPAAVSLLGRELKRSRVVLWSIDKPFLYSTTAAAISTPLNSTAGINVQGAVTVPINTPIILLNADQVWVACASVTATDVATVCSVIETWAD
jgi:hypothetical protein